GHGHRDRQARDRGRPSGRRRAALWRGRNPADRRCRQRQGGEKGVRLVAGLMLAVLAACSDAAEPVDGEWAITPDPKTLVSSASAAETLLTRYTGPHQSQPQQGGPYAPRDDCGALDGAWEFR